jgi:hypothetical protein
VNIAMNRHRLWGPAKSRGALSALVDLRQDGGWIWAALVVVAVTRTLGATSCGTGASLSKLVTTIEHGKGFQMTSIHADSRRLFGKFLEPNDLVWE